MGINKILVSFTVQEKIFKKHTITRKEIEYVFFDDPYYYRDKKDRYIAIGDNYITVVFEYSKTDAEIITAYRSSKWQKNSTKKSKLYCK